MRDFFLKASEEVERELQKKDRVNIDTLKRLWKRAEDRFFSLTKIDDEIMNQLIDVDISQEEMDEEMYAVQEFRDIWNDINSAIDNVMQKDDGDGNAFNSIQNAVEGRSRYKLPKLKLVEFDGSPKQWLQFWSQFKSIDEDKDLSPEEKFSLLIITASSQMQ